MEIPQQWAAFCAEAHASRDMLFARQQTELRGRAASTLIAGIDILRLSKPASR